MSYALNDLAGDARITDVDGLSGTGKTTMLHGILVGIISTRQKCGFRVE